MDPGSSGSGAVWHGNTAQFHYASELQQFLALYQLLESRQIDAMAAVKPGMHVGYRRLFPQVLFNVGPCVPAEATQEHKPKRTAFIPVPNDWRKNFYTNALRCRRDRAVRRAST